MLIDGLLVIALALVLSTSWEAAQPVRGAAGAAACATSGPAGGAYTVSLCITAPAQGAALSGAVSVSGSSAATAGTGTAPGTDHLVWYLNGTYLLTDFQSPYGFTLPTASWVDGSYTLAVEAVMRDGFTTGRASIPVTFHNNVTTPPTNTGTFTPATGAAPSAGKPLVVAAVGDGAGGERNETSVVNLISAWNPDLLLYLGDVYEEGSLAEFYNWYGENAQFYGKFSAITDPTVGNHEYLLGQANGYFNYWNNVPGYYSFNTAGWHIVSLNANGQYESTYPGSPQYQWLTQDLAANPAGCTLLFWHEPLFNVGSEGSSAAAQPLWTLAAQNQVDIVLTGHDHDYQRWAPLNASGQPDPNGITEFVDGTGGHAIQTFTATDSRMVKGYDSSVSPLPYGALKLDLYPTKATYQFINTAGTLLDTGTITCHRAASVPPTPTPSPTPTAQPTPTPIPTTGGGTGFEIFLPEVVR